MWLKFQKRQAAAFQRMVDNIDDGDLSISDIRAILKDLQWIAIVQQHVGDYGYIKSSNVQAIDIVRSAVDYLCIGLKMLVRKPP